MSLFAVLVPIIKVTPADF